MILQQAKNNVRNRMQEFYQEFLGDLEAKREKERKEALERERIEKLSLEEQLKIQMATDEEMRRKQRDERIKQELLQQRRARVATAFELTLSRIIPDLLCTSVLNQMKSVTAPCYFNQLRLEEEDDEEEALELRAYVFKYHRMATIKPDLLKDEDKKVFEVAREKKIQLTTKKMTKKLGSFVLKDLNAAHTEISLQETLAKKKKLLELQQAQERENAKQQAAAAIEVTAQKIKK